jgi:hypothetical protein
VARWLEQLADGLHRIALMLILDVQTRWYSTHQMLHKLFSFFFFFFFHISNNNNSLSIGRAIQYRKVIERFVAVNKDLRAFELTDDNWSAITLISQWLKSFRAPPLCKCLLQRGQCLHQLLPSSAASRTPFAKPFALCPTTHPQN